MIDLSKISAPYQTCLVLGDGGARAFAHVGVLEVLEEAKMKPDLIVATGMGAYIGTAYAATGSVAGLRDFLLRVPLGSFFQVNRKNNMGVFLNEDLISFWAEYTKRKTFDELKIPTWVTV